MKRLRGTNSVIGWYHAQRMKATGGENQGCLLCGSEEPGRLVVLGSTEADATLFEDTSQRLGETRDIHFQLIWILCLNCGHLAALSAGHLPPPVVGVGSMDQIDLEFRDEKPKKPPRGGKPKLVK